MSAADVELEPCAWLTGPVRWSRPCHKPGVAWVKRGHLEASVCQRHLDRALAATPPWMAEP